MKVGDLVRYIPYGRHEPTEDIGIIVNIDENGYYEVRWCDAGLMFDTVFGGDGQYSLGYARIRLEALCK